MKFDAVIFDIDNVLIDTRASYTDCILKTVETYLETILKFQPSRIPILTRRDVEAFKSLGGFNDDWDTCYGLLLCLLRAKVKKRSIRELAKQKDMARFIQSVKSKPLGVNGMVKILGRDRLAEVGLKPGSTLKKIADIFQRYYLSRFVWNEKLLIPKSFLKRLKRCGLAIGIATGRSREEAQFALRRFQIDSLIDTLVTQDDTPKHKKKPHPYGLLKIASRLGRNRRYLYVGDLPDDMLAAQRAKKEIKIASCGYLAASTIPKEMKKEMRKAKADYTSTHALQLMQIILS